MGLGLGRNWSGLLQVAIDARHFGFLGFWVGEGHVMGLDAGVEGGLAGGVWEV